jgi:hypothetical protein
MCKPPSKTEQAGDSSDEKNQHLPIIIWAFAVGACSIKAVKRFLDVGYQINQSDVNDIKNTASYAIYHLSPDHLLECQMVALITKLIVHCGTNVVWVICQVLCHTPEGHYDKYTVSLAKTP